MRNLAPSKSMLVLLLSMSGIARLLWLVEPWVIGQLINLIQLEGATAWPTIQLYLWGLVFVHLLAWLFHGRSRIREEDMKFQVAEKYLSNIFHKVSSLPMQRHADHHSWQTIDKINKGMYAIREFSGNQFMYSSTFVFAVWSILSLYSIWRKAWLLMTFFAIGTLIVVYKFDQIIVPLIKEKNNKEHVVMSTLFDLLSNIKTIITLRCESKAREAIEHKVHDVFPVFKSYSLRNEWKWFTMDMMMQTVIMFVLAWYIWSVFSVGGTVLIGTLMMLYQYIEKMSTAFDNFTWQYSGIVTQKADMQATTNIHEAY